MTNVLLDYYRDHGCAAPLLLKIEAETDIDVLRGMAQQVKRDGRMTPEIETAFIRRADKLKGGPIQSCAISKTAARL